MNVYRIVSGAAAQDEKAMEALRLELERDHNVSAVIDRRVEIQGRYWSIVFKVECQCSCHGCCVPLDSSCEDCPENHS